MTYSYHNTTESSGQDLDQYEEKAKSQEDRILEWFQYHTQPSSPSKALSVVFGNSVPLTSVRRAFSNLTHDGELIKTNTQVRGPYGRPETVWRLADEYTQREMF